MAKRSYAEYEKELLARKKKQFEFLMSRPTVEEFIRELERMNRRKKGRRYIVPASILLLLHFLKTAFKMDDRLLAHFLTSIMKPYIDERQFDHSTIVKRREGLDLKVPSGITPEKLAGKTLYFDGVCLRLGRGGYYRSKAYKTEAKYLRIGVFTDENGKAVDFTIGDEHDSEVNMIKEKLPLIEKSRAKALVVDGAGSARDIVCPLVKAGIKPVIRASKAVVESKRNAPPPHDCIREKKEEELIWDSYAKEQEDYQKWREETGYSMRWVYSEGRFSAFKRMHGEEIICRTQKAIHDEVCAKFMLLDGGLPKLWC